MRHSNLGGAAELPTPNGEPAPVFGSRLKATPVPLRSSRLPNTMACTITAVPRWCGTPCSSRYVTARGLFQDEKTALTAARS